MLEREHMAGDISQRYVEGAAYHEASHIVVAAVQGLPLVEAGLRIYETGAGFAHYSVKQPDGSTNVGNDPCRERTIIATLAGTHCSREILSAGGNG